MNNATESAAALASGVCRITDWGLIRASGADAAKFLQGQLTNDVLGLAPNQARLAGFCSAKGRLQASFIVWRDGDEDFMLACSASLLAATLKRLSMFVLRARCKLSDVSGEWALYGMVGTAADTRVEGMDVWQTANAGGVTTVRLPDSAAKRRALVAVRSDVLASPEDGTAEPPEAGTISLDDWKWYEVQSGISMIEAATADRFVPQMLNFELVGGVDFGKGCYPGQEVVARSQYRGTTKRRTFLFDCDDLPVAGQDVFAAGPADEPVGTVAAAAPRPDGHGASALVEVRLAALGAGDLRLGDAGGAVLSAAAMPYPVPSDIGPVA